MSCKHRFYSELIPNWDIEHLFIGTFNPEWNSLQKNDAEYFYGRKTNNFWAILPLVFGGEDLKGKEKSEWIAYLKKNKIGLTDLISEIKDVNIDNPDDNIKITKGFSDSVLDKLDLEFNTSEILKLIEYKKNSLKGVYFTRSTDSGIKTKIWPAWIEVKNHSQNLSIYSSELFTPARRGGSASKKAAYWKSKII